jgi:D-glycero-alpha-D-manno-heptose 1-phosphate guanylyltransferase
MSDSILAHTGAVVLAGGLGTRLRSVTGEHPKVLAPVLGRPYLCHLLDRLERAGLRDVLLCTGYRSEEISASIGTRHGALSVRYSVEPHPLGTGGALRHALPMMTAEELLVLNGDSYPEADFAEFAARHRDNRARASLLLTKVDEVGRFGMVDTDRECRITGFTEKGGARGAGWINAGAYLLGREVIAEIPAGREASLEHELFPSLIGRGFYGFRLGHHFIDIGTPDSYREAGAFLQARGAGSEPFRQGEQTS